MRHPLLAISVASAVVAGVLLLDRTALQWHPAAGPPGSLSAAVEQLNTRMARSPVARNRSKLTVSELLNAAAQHQEMADATPEEVVVVLNHICRTKHWPKQAYLGHVTDYERNVWWIRLRITTSDGTSWAFPVREEPVDPSRRHQFRIEVEAEAVGHRCGAATNDRY